MTKKQLFIYWITDGNVITNLDGTYSTQDAVYCNRIKSFYQLKKYFLKEFFN